MFEFHVTSSPLAAVSRYSDLNINILEVEITLESEQEGRDTPLVEYYNQKQMTRWFRFHLRLPLLQHQLYTEWYLREVSEIKIMVK